MTLLYPMQLLDELPMIYGSAILIYSEYDLLLAIKEYQDLNAGRTAKSCLVSRLFFGIGCATYCFIVTFIYLSVWKNPIFHEIAYGIMVFVIMFESFYLISRLKMSKHLYMTSLFYYALGFLFWNLDNNFCNYLKASRGKYKKFKFSFNSHFI